MDERFASKETGRVRARSLLSVVLLLPLIVLSGRPSVDPSTFGSLAGFQPGAEALDLFEQAGAGGDELFVAFHDDVRPAQRRALLAEVGSRSLEVFALTGVHRVRVEEGPLGAALRLLSASSLVRFAEPNAPLRVAQIPDLRSSQDPARIIPNDPLFADQAWIWELLEAPAGWAITQGQRSTVVAVLDGAVDLDHPDLVDSIWTNEDEIPNNGLDDDGNGFIDDVHGYDFIGSYRGPGDIVGEDADPDSSPGDSAVGDGIDQDSDGVPDGAVSHGTQVAGILAATGDNAFGFAGAAWNISIMPVRVTGPEGNGFFSSFVSALEYAVANGADIVNMSLEASALPNTVVETVTAVHEAGVIMVGAAGNSGFGVRFPAALAEIIAVGATRGDDEPDLRALFSPISGGVEFVAPGDQIPTLAIEPITGLPTFGSGTGTSFSAPMVSGLIALIKSLRPTATLSDVRAFLRDGAVDLPDADTPRWDGFGRVNFRRSLEAALAGPLPAPVIDSAVVTTSLIVIQGRAVPAMTVVLTELARGEVIASGIAGPSGSFELSIQPSSLLETTAQLDLVATVGGASGLSPPSLPVSLRLQRDVRLFPGWNLVSWAGVTGPGTDDGVFAALPGGVERVFAWREGLWDVYLPGSSFVQIDEVRTGDGLWVFLRNERSVIWTYERAPYITTLLHPGWQMVAWPGPSVLIADALRFTPAVVESLFAWSALESVFTIYRTAQPQVADLNALAHLDAVWVLVGEGGGAWPGP